MTAGRRTTQRRLSRLGSCRLAVGGEDGCPQRRAVPHGAPGRALPVALRIVLAMVPRADGPRCCVGRFVWWWNAWWGARNPASTRGVVTVWEQSGDDNDGGGSGRVPPARERCIKQRTVSPELGREGRRRSGGQRPARSRRRLFVLSARRADATGGLPVAALPLGGGVQGSARLWPTVLRSPSRHVPHNA